MKDTILVGITMTAVVCLMTACMFLPPEEEIVKPSRDELSLVWSDEFDSGTVPSSSNWNYQTGAGGWGNAEVQTYTSDAANAYVSDGTLKIRAIKDGGGNWTSARLRSNGKRDYTYGYFEIRAKIAGGAGTWPAIWMMPTDSDYGSWPDSGEIDIMEHATSTFGLNKIFGTVHRDAGSGGDGYGVGSRIISTATTAFHLYAIEWTANDIYWFYDNELLGSYPRSGGAGWSWWPFDKNFHFILNVAVGGTLGGAISPSLTSDILEIDYVRVYQ